MGIYTPEPPAKKMESFPSLRFPQDLGTSEVPNYIRFEPQIVQYGGTKGLDVGNGDFNLSTFSTSNNPVSTQANTRGHTFSLNDIKGGIVQTLAGEANNLFSSIKSAFNSVSVDLLGGAIKGRVNLGSAGALSAGIKTDKNTLFSPGSINLYLPESLQTASSVDYGATELGQMGMAAVSSGLSNIDSFRKGEGGKSSLDNFVQNALPGAIQDMSQSDDRLKAAFALSNGQVTNNFSFQIFQGVQHRSFSYEFKMIARDGNDSKVIKNICDTFLYYMLPSKTQSDFNFYEVPPQWDITYQGQNGLLEYHQQPKPCFLQSVNVDYGGDTGNSLYSDGAPMSVSLSLEFVEIEPLYRGDRAVKKG